MPKPDLDDREAAMAAAIAARTLREDRLDAEREAQAAPSTRAVLFSVLFVVVVSVGILAAMVAIQ